MPPRSPEYERGFDAAVDYYDHAVHTWPVDRWPAQLYEAYLLGVLAGRKAERKRPTRPEDEQ